MCEPSTNYIFQNKRPRCCALCTMHFGQCQASSAELGWWEMGTATSCTECSRQVAGHIHTADRSFSNIGSLCAAVLIIRKLVIEAPRSAICLCTCLLCSRLFVKRLHSLLQTICNKTKVLMFSFIEPNQCVDTSSRSQTSVCVDVCFCLFVYNK